MARPQRCFRLVMNDDGVVRMIPTVRPPTLPPRRYFPVEIDDAPVQDQIHAVFPDLGPGPISAEALQVRSRWALRWAVGVASHRAIIANLEFRAGWYEDIIARCFSVIAERVADVILSSEGIPNTDALIEQESEWVDWFGPADDTLFATVGWARWAEYVVAQDEAAMSSFAQPQRYRSFEDFAESDARILLAETGEVMNVMKLYAESAWDIAALWRGAPTMRDLDKQDRIDSRNEALSRGVRGAARGVSSVTRGAGAMIGFFVDVADQRAKREEREALNELRRARTRNYNRRNSRW